MKIYVPLNIQRFKAEMSLSLNENSWDVNSNTSNVTLTITLRRTSGSTYFNTAHTGTAYIDGVAYSFSLNLPSSVTSNSTTVNATVGHNSDGSKYVGYSASLSVSGVGSWSANGGTQLTTIPRYANITGFNSYAIDETTIRVDWSADANCDAVQYSLNGGGWTGASGTSFNIGGLSAGTNYTIKIRVRRSDSQLWTESGTRTSGTYSYPYCTNSPNFIIGNSVTLSLYNPLSRNVTVSILSASGQVLATQTTNGTSISGFNSSENIQNYYNSIPNNIDGTYQVRVVYGSSTKTRNNGNKYSVNSNINKPIFEDFDYSTNLSELTGDNDTVINGKTTITFTISSENKAVAQNSATMQRYVFECGSNQVAANYADTVTVTLSNCTSNIIRVTAIDSRGNETTVSKTITNFRTYYQPTFISLNVDREDGIEETALLDLKLNFWNYSFGSRRNNIISLKYRLKEKTSENWSNWYSINPSLLIINREEAELNNYLVYSDGVSQGFTVGTTYDFQLQVIDGNENIEISTVESDIFTLIDGLVAFSVFKDNDGNYHIGINGMPDANHTLKVHGDIDYS